jgi:hypothetical protein
MYTYYFAIGIHVSLHPHPPHFIDIDNIKIKQKDEKKRRTPN